MPTIHSLTCPNQLYSHDNYTEVTFIITTLTFVRRAWQYQGVSTLLHLAHAHLCFTSHEYVVYFSRHQKRKLKRTGQCQMKANVFRIQMRQKMRTSDIREQSNAYCTRVKREQQQKIFQPQTPRKSMIYQFLALQIKISLLQL